jgi:hypothetical protein
LILIQTGSFFFCEPNWVVIEKDLENEYIILNLNGFQADRRPRDAFVASREMKLLRVMGEGVVLLLGLEGLDGGGDGLLRSI